MEKRYRTSSHATYDIKYHFVWIPKYRFRVLDGAIKEKIQMTIARICEAMDIEMIEGHVGKDHVHVCLSVPPKYSPAEVMKRIKGKTSEVIFEKFPEFKKRFWAQHLWGRGYFVSTVGVDEEIIRKYIRTQQKDDTAEKQMKLWK